MSKYERYYDKGQLEPLLELFHDECVVDYDVLGSIRGKAEMRKFLEEYFTGKTDIQDCFHMIVNPWVEINGNEAIGRFHFFGVYIFKDIGAVWLVGFYKNKFVKENGKWKIKELRWEAKYISPYSEGWEKKPFADKYLHMKLKKAAEKD